MSSYEGKKAFFSQLEALSSIGSDELGEDEILQREKSRAFFARKRVKPLPRPDFHGAPIQPPRRVLSAQTVGSTSR